MSSDLAVSRVFVPGGNPTFTYVPRDAQQLEGHVTSYLRDRYKMLSVSGPTKTGKTVLLKNQIPNAIYLSGGSIATVGEFWETLAEELGAESETTLKSSQTTATGANTSATLDIRVARATTGASAQGTSGIETTRAWKTSAKASARTLLKENPDTTIVIDDFHYIDPEVQLQIVRGLKDLVFNGTGLVVAAVPHRAYDVVRIEKEMTGRVSHLSVGFWDREDLLEIPRRGFEKLNFSVTREISERLTEEAFQSPHLMQEFCRRMCYENGYEQGVADSPAKLDIADWNEFFKKLAPDTAKSTFDILKRGPRQRSDRLQRKLMDGTTGDIYEVVLRAIAATGPLTTMTYEQLRSQMKNVVVEAPQRHEVTRVLEQITELAKKQEGEPVLEWDAELSTLYVADPFFAYWLRWSEPSMA